MDDTINLLVLHQLVESIEIADIHAYELVVCFVLNIFEVSEVACINEFIQVDNVVFRVLVHEQTNYMAADETNTTGDNYIFHCLIIFQVRNTFFERLCPIWNLDAKGFFDLGFVKN